MTIINSSSIFDLVNHGFVYLCQADDKTYWVRSVAGNWAQIKTVDPIPTDILAGEFATFQQKGLVVTENDIKIDNSSQVIVPVKIDPTPDPDPIVLPDPIVDPVIDPIA